jgi:type IV secretion system protein TrbL
MGRETGGSSLGGIAAAAKGAAAQRMSGALGLGAAAERGRDAAFTAMTGGKGSGSGAPADSGGEGSAPVWAQRLRSEQNARHRRQVALQGLKEGDHGGAGAAPDIKERD